MATPQNLDRPPNEILARIDALPQGPGVYFFKNALDEVIYIGKAVSIRKRVKGHYRCYSQAGSKEGVMLSHTRRIDCIETPSEEEALLLEAALVKQYLPKYNQALRDDKSYPYLKITQEAFPRLLVVRRRKADGGIYFGPFIAGQLLRSAVKWLRREFPLRTCRVMPKKLCLWHHLGQCPGPCENKVTPEQYRRHVTELRHFLEGRRQALVRTLMRRMQEYSRLKEFEKAKGLYDEIRALSEMPADRKAVAPAAATLKELQAALSLANPPQRIECFDISNIQGRDAVGSMVVFENAKPKKNDYRLFKIRQAQGIDDYRMMREVIVRRYAGSLAQQLPSPDLILIDGGRGHLSAACRALVQAGAGTFAAASIAKEHEHLFLPDKESAIVLSQRSPALQLLRHIRDEAHRFAISYYRRLHRKRLTRSALDEIAGVGPVAQAKIMAAALTARRIEAMTPAQLADRTGIGISLAARVIDALVRVRSQR
ncbi:MAG: excinuclease ABC subunit UvrC [Candidatus Omnitrophota bacterium]